MDGEGCRGGGGKGGERGQGGEGGGEEWTRSNDEWMFVP